MFTASPPFSPPLFSSSSKQQPTTPPLLQTLCFSLADNLINRGFIASAQHVIDRMLNNSSSLPGIISTIHFVDLRGLNLNSDNYYSFLIQKLVDSNQTHLACTLLKKGIVPIPSILNSMILCYCELGDLSEAIDLLEQLAGFEPLCCKIGYNVLLSWLCREERVPDAFHLFNRMAERGAFLGISCYTLLIDGLCFRGDLDAAFQVLNEIIVADSQPPVHLYKTFSFLINKYCKDNKVDYGLKLLEIMCRSNLAPTVHFYTVLISSLFKEKRLDEAFELFNKMLESDVAPDHVIFLTLLKMMPMGNAVHLAIDILQAVAKRGRHIDPYLFSNPVNPPSSEEPEEIIELLFNKLLESNTYFATDILLVVYLDSDLVDDIAKLAATPLGDESVLLEVESKRSLLVETLIRKSEFGNEVHGYQLKGNVLGENIENESRVGHSNIRSISKSIFQSNMCGLYRIPVKKYIQSLHGSTPLMRVVLKFLTM